MTETPERKILRLRLAAIVEEGRIELIDTISGAPVIILNQISMRLVSTLDDINKIEIKLSQTTLNGKTPPLYGLK